MSVYDILCIMRGIALPLGYQDYFHVIIIFDLLHASVLEDHVPDEEVGCIVGLHACADLTNTVIQAFLSSQKIK